MYGKFFASTFTGSMVGSGLNVFAVWGYVVANAKADGTVELNPPILAAVLGCARGEVEAAIAVLCAPDTNSRSKKHDGRRLQQAAAFLYEVVNFTDYRAMRDDDSRRNYMRDYMRDYRAKQAGEGVTEPLTANVNTRKPSLSQAEADTDTEKSKETSTSKATSKACRASRLAKDWKPDSDLIDWAETERPGHNIGEHVATFRDYWIAVAGAKGVKLDWPATFRNWIRKTTPGDPRHGQPHHRSPSRNLSAVERVEASIQARRRAESADEFIEGTAVTISR